MRGRDGSQRRPGPVYSELLSDFHCVPLCPRLAGGSEDSLVQAKVMSTQRHINTHGVLDPVRQILCISGGSAECM